MYKFESFASHNYTQFQEDILKYLNSNVKVAARMDTTKITSCDLAGPMRGVVYYCDTPSNDVIQGDHEWHSELIEIKDEKEESFMKAYQKVADSLNERMTPIERQSLSPAQCACVRLGMETESGPKSYRLTFYYPKRV